MNKNTMLLKSTIPTLLLLTFCFFNSLGQSSDSETQKLKQFSGVVLDASTQEGVPGIHIYIPEAGTGVSSNQHGFFSMTVYPGDSVVIRSIGYAPISFIIPDNEHDFINIVVELKEKALYLPEIEVMPFPSREEFEEAFLALEVPEDEATENAKDNLSQEKLAEVSLNMGMGADQNHKYYMNQQIQQEHTKFQLNDWRYSNPLLNPFNWIKLVKSIKNGDFKKKK